jgi:hypothetical protein
MRNLSIDFLLRSDRFETYDSNDTGIQDLVLTNIEQSGTVRSTCRKLYE